MAEDEKRADSTSSPQADSTGSPQAVAQAPSDAELFAGEMYEELSEKQVFVGDEDFFRSLAAPSPAKLRLDEQPQEPRQQSRQLIKKVAVFGACLIVVTLVYWTVKSPHKPSISGAKQELQLQEPNVSAVQPAPMAEKQVAQKQPEPAPEPADQQVTKPETVFQPGQSVSLKAAEGLYSARQYDKAYAAYDYLCQKLPTKMENERDFLRLRMAQCANQTNDLERATSLLEVLANSPSLIVRIMADCQMSLLEMQKSNYLRARSKTYEVMAMVSTVQMDKNLALTLEQNAQFIAAEALTRQILSLSDLDADLPPELWKAPAQVDPFAGLDEEQIRSLVSSDCEMLRAASLAPQIKKIEAKDGSARWSVACNGASIEELLSRFATNAGLDVSWSASSSDSARGAGGVIEEAVRARRVTIYLPGTTTRQCVTVAAGAVGLIGRLGEKDAIEVIDPEKYRSLSEHLALLCEEATSLWRSFVLAFSSDQRVANAHFAMALLQSRQNRTAEPIAEFKLIANTLAGSSLAPYALLHSSKLKANLRDYMGAREDLKQLVEQYQNSEIAGRCHMNLAENTGNAGMKDEAANIYRKVYNLNLSPKSQAIAALRAGECYYEIADYASAATWLAKYIESAKNEKSEELWSAYYTLGRAYFATDKAEQACEAFRKALGGQLSREQYIETVSALVDSYIEQKRLVEAIDILEDIPMWQFSQNESIGILLLKSKVFRAMGLVDKAITTIGDKADYVSDQKLVARVHLELGNCFIAKEDFELAHRALTRALTGAEAGEPTRQAMLHLAEVCLRLQRYSETIRLCRQLLDLEIPEQSKQKVRELMAAAYKRLEEYDKAALALLGK
jgi:tetratricopeptide (TPR) repeat protein